MSNRFPLLESALKEKQPNFEAMPMREILHVINEIRDDLDLAPAEHGHSIDRVNGETEHALEKKRKAQAGAITETCEHGKELDGYCHPCGRIHGS